MDEGQLETELEKVLPDGAAHGAGADGAARGAGALADPAPAIDDADDEESFASEEAEEVREVGSEAVRVEEPPPAPPPLPPPLPPPAGLPPPPLSLIEQLATKEWGVFKLTHREQGTAGASKYGSVQVLCPFHKKTHITLCKKTESCRGAGPEHLEQAVLMGLWWASQAHDFLGSTPTWS